jgi:UDPglucose 6-dehydrogenase
MICTVVGLGKLGLPYAALLADSGYITRGIDENLARINQIIEKNLEPEPGLNELIARNLGDKLLITTNWEEALEGSDISFLVVPTPSQPNGKFSNDYLISAIRKIIYVVKKTRKKHVIVVVSTVMPTTCDQILIPLIKDLIGDSNYGELVYLAYSPEFIALGTILKNMRYPDMILVGESESYAGDLLLKAQTSFTQNSPQVRRMTLSSAEITKISVNTFVTSKISYANMIGEIAAFVPNADYKVILESLGMDSRIGGKYLSAGLGFGGPCFPRDNRAFTRFAKDFGVDASLAIATEKINLRQPEVWTKRIIDFVDKREARIAILGLSYKPGSFVTDESQSIIIANNLASRGYKIFVHDPLAFEYSSVDLNNGIERLTDLTNLDDFDLIVVAVDWPEYKQLKANKNLIRV